ncbi:hypothetical protein IL992_33665 [Microbispora sp. NEAU-D428]|jgi:hypothetical protein|uniref:DUF6247 family protein n=1 Tax=Microbispora sitophila TaxID=2771537 RepID=UPI0018670322|nr:DUF6247 family protein [Microbispora sitophila]MBE3014090.1 hypothetical protein [Microbispora sitophila]
MSAQPQEFPPEGPLPEKNLRAIRRALVVPQDREGFDAGLDVVLAEVRASLDLGRLSEFIHTWWLIACDSVKDPQGRRDVYERATRVQELADAGRPIPRGDKTWRELLAERGVER